MFCRQQVAELAEREPEFVKNNLHLVVIGSGEASTLTTFRDITGYRGTLLTDPTRRSFIHLGFGNRISGLIGWRPISGAIKAFLAGFRPGAMQGSALQLGGALIVDTDGSILFQYQSMKAGDHPLVEQLLTPH